MTFTQIPQDTFEKLQANAGVILSDFDPTSPTLTRANIICPTSGGVKVTVTPDFSDWGDDVDNCPKNSMELKHQNNVNCTFSFTCLSYSVNTLKLAIGAATAVAPTSSAVGTVTVARDLTAAHFTNSIWWVSDLADGRWIAAELSNALSTGGLSIQSTDNGKGKSDITLMGHYSIENPDVVPIKFYEGKLSA